MAPQDSKGVSILTEAQILFLALVVSRLRKSSLEIDMERDVQDTRIVLKALAISGFAVIPQITIEALKKLFTGDEI